MHISRTSFAADGRSLTLLALVLGAASICNAANITYNVNLTIGAGGVTGDIVTDSTIGALNDSAILDWNLVLNDGTYTFDLLGPLQGGFNSELLDHSADLSATATQLSFDGTDSGENYFYFIWDIDSGTPEVSEAVLTFFNPDFFSPGAFNGEGADLDQAGGQWLNLQGDFFSPGYVSNQFTSQSGIQVVGTATGSDSGTPEPSTLALLGAGLTLLGFCKLGNRHPRGR